MEQETKESIKAIIPELELLMEQYSLMEVLLALAEYCEVKCFDEEAELLTKAAMI